MSEDLRSLLRRDFIITNPNQITYTSSSVSSFGTPGPRGVQGPPGLQGPPGSGSTSNKVFLANFTGYTIPAFMPIATQANGSLTLVDVSIEAQAMATLGISAAAIPNGTVGTVSTVGVVPGAGADFNVQDVIYISSTGTSTNVKPSVGLNGFIEGDFVIKLGTVTLNPDDPTIKDMDVNIQIMGQL